MRNTIVGIFICIYVLASVLTFPHATQAKSTLTFSPINPQLFYGDIFDTAIIISADKAINAMHLEVLYPNDIVDVVDISTGDSIITLWKNKPESTQHNGALVFEGGLPTPGFIGQNGVIAHISFKIKAIAPFEIRVQNASILLNNGLGTEDQTETTTVKLESKRPHEGYTPKTPIKREDTEPPTNLMLNIGRDTKLFNNYYFAAFTGQDNVAIDHFEIAENPSGITPNNSEWYRATSPSKLRTQHGNIIVFLKAVDTSGNETITKIHKNLSATENKGLFIYTLLILLVSGILLWVWNRRQKTIQKNKIVL